MTKRTPSRVGVRLLLGGASNDWHHVEGWPGLYHPVTPTLIELVGLAEDDARAMLDADDKRRKDAHRALVAFAEERLERCRLDAEETGLAYDASVELNVADAKRRSVDPPTLELVKVTEDDAADAAEALFVALGETKKNAKARWQAALHEEHGRMKSEAASVAAVPTPAEAGKE